MAAAPWKGIIHVDYADGTSDDFPISASDVANAFVTFDGTSLAFWQTTKAAIITNIDIVTGGTDCNKLKLWINNRDVGRTLLQPTMLTTVTTKPKIAPIRINGNRIVQLQQLAV
jgi:hypothetical protein